MEFSCGTRSTIFARTRRSPRLWIGTFLLFFVLPGTIACSRFRSKDTATPAGPSLPVEGSRIRYSAVGASDVTGIGSTVPCLFLDCRDGTGYVAVAARRLREKFDVTVNNLGIPTAVISRRSQQLGQLYGRTIAGNFIENEVPFMPTDTTVVTIFAGANDVTTLLDALGFGAGLPNQSAYLDEQVRAFRDDYLTLLSAIRSRAPSARLVLLNLPNLAGAPFLATAPLINRQAAQRIAVGMTTTAINTLASNDVVVVDLMCDARMYQASTYSSDGFHPNDAGYALIADEVVKAITTSGNPLPQSSCSFMRLVP
jgi:lysophospholipase L1-like esterase